MTCSTQNGNGFGANDDAEFDDPVQGVALSCNLIAALSSVAWVCNSTSCASKIPQIILTSGVYTVNFRSGPQNVNNRFEVNADGSLKNAKSTDSGMWPAIYEKAWIKMAQGSVPCDVSSVNTQYWPQNHYALGQLVPWGLNSREYSDLYQYWYDPKDPNLAKNPPQAPVQKDPITTITSRCDRWGKIKVPMVAWTGASGHFQENYDQMRHGHCYSVLGYLTGFPDYILLRNPYGTTFGVNNSTNVLPYVTNGNWVGIDAQIPSSSTHYMYCTGSCSPTSPYPVAKLALVNNSPGARGIFGLHKNAFVNYLAGIGWAGTN